MRHDHTTTIVLVAVLALLAATASAGPQARIAGIAVDTSGEPIAGATITITSELLPKFNKVTETDAEGQFKVLILDATYTYLFTVTAPGYLEVQQEIKVPVGTNDNFFTFELATPTERAETRQQDLMEQPGYLEYGEAKELLEAGKTAEARARLEDALAAMPDLIEALEVVAEIDFDSGDNKLALASARRCLEEDDESLPCLAVAANAASNLGDSAAHEIYITRYQELNPDDPATIFNKAAALLNKMDDEGARPLLEQCLAVDPAFAKCLFEYGMLLLRAGDLEGAKAQLEKYLEVAPDGPDATTAAETVKYL
jgi:tetratricopeptide (TPR) repeat protein